MKLNADILYDELKSRYRVKMYGGKVSEMTLSRPGFYMDNETHFLKDHLYLATADHLPSRPEIEGGSVLISIGEPARMHYYVERLTLIVIYGKAEYFSVYTQLQKIFEKYDNWNAGLFDIFKEECDIQDIIDLSSVSLGFPMYIIDSDFHFIAAHHFDEEREHERWKLRDSSEILSSDSLGTYLQSGSMQFETHDPIIFEYDEGKTIAVNLYDRLNSYIGCLCIDCTARSEDKGIEALAAYLGKLLEKALGRNPNLLYNDRNTRKQLLRGLIEEIPMTSLQKVQLRALNHQTQYVCVSLHMLDEFKQIPSNYICNVMEITFPGTVAFPYREGIVSFVDLKIFNGGEYREQMNVCLHPLLENMKLYAGISDEFDDLYASRRHYQQAEIAVENGLLTSDEGNCFYFSSFVLMEMVTNSLGGFPPEMFFSKGFRALLEHDKTSDVSYLETLKTFLEENMSFSRASELLYIHRSTLIDRISRIERELGIDLRDYNERLQLQLIIKALEIQELVHKDR